MKNQTIFIVFSFVLLFSVNKVYAQDELELSVPAPGIFVAQVTPDSPSIIVVQSNRPTNPAISLDRAIEIAYQDLARRGINATYRRHSGIHWHRGQWVWELLFRTQGERMPLIEFYINVDNGNIVKFEWDD
jgi:uncharacterized membrane protein YkoI